MAKVFTVKIEGAAGQGIKSMGRILGKLATQSGYYAYTYSEYPSLIRGGHNVMYVSYALEPVLAPHTSSDLTVSGFKDNIQALRETAAKCSLNLEALEILIKEEYG